MPRGVPPQLRRQAPAWFHPPPVTPSVPERSSRRALVLFGAGVALGIAAAAAGLLLPGEGEAPPEGAVALVNGEPILADTWQRLLEGLAAERREPPGDAERRRALDRLIEEELLVQRGLDLGLARHDRRVRAELVSAVIESVVAEVGAREATPEEIERFYESERAFFARPGRLRVQRVLLRADAGGEEALARAREAAERIGAGDAPDVVAAQLGDEEIAPVPDALLPPAKLREYLGPAALEVALGLEAGQPSEPLPAPGGWQVLVVAEREPETLPPLTEVEPEVRAEWRRRAGDAALRAYLDELRATADVRVAEEPR
jgi:parvulin-like peptidyl-prolyl isomerase